MSWPKTPEQHGHAIVKLLADQNREFNIGIHQHFIKAMQ